MMRWMRGQLLFRVVVILIGICHDLAKHHSGMQLWIGFGTGKHFRYYHINSICQEFGEKKAHALPFFTPSRVLVQRPSPAVEAKSQRGKHGKYIRQPLLHGFISASHINGGFFPLEFTSAAFKLIEQFTCIIYNSTTSYDKVNDL